MEFAERLTFRHYVQINFRSFCLFLTGLTVALVCAWQASGRAVGPDDQDNLPVADRVEIIKVLLEENFRRPTSATVFISSRNLSEEVQKNFPRVKNLKVRFLSPEEASQSDVCFYEFGEFTMKRDFVHVSFGNCRDGLSYTFKKYGNKWKSLLLMIEKQ